MFLVALSTVYRSIRGWLERYFGFSAAVRASCFMHLSWFIWPKSAPSSSGAASSFIIHMLITYLLINQLLKRAHMEGVPGCMLSPSANQWDFNTSCIDINTLGILLGKYSKLNIKLELRSSNFNFGI